MPASLRTNTITSHYRILHWVGAGGMGEVYRACDTRLDRVVAIKVLPASFANDDERLDRFEQEARATSALNHPNILTVYDVGNHEGSPYIVSEFLEGEELRGQLKDGALAPQRAMDYARQIASGLAAAHDRGIVHRDLKPENIFVTKTGRVKILDFGLAKLQPAKLPDDAGSELPTQKVLTSPGIVMGTVGYMSPEQVRGEPTDNRSDIFSFGAILYEMLTGQRAFDRETMAETMTAILKEDPEDIGAISAKVSPQLERIVRRCLEKKPEHRFHSAHDLGFALEALSIPSGSRVEANAPARTKPGGLQRRLLHDMRLAWGAALVALALAGVLSWRIAPGDHAGPPRPGAYLFIPPPPGEIISTAAVSPDGRQIAYITFQRERWGSENELWVRPLASADAMKIAGARGAYGLFWSPDSEWLAFFTPGTLNKVRPSTGAITELGAAPGASKGTWGTNGIILLSLGGSPMLHQIPESGGAPTAVTVLDRERGDLRHTSPAFLPDAERFLFVVDSAIPQNDGVYLGRLGQNTSSLLVRDAAYAVFAAPDTVMMMRGTDLYQQQFDLETGRLRSDPIRVAGGLSESYVQYPPFSVADTGTLIFLPWDRHAGELVWYDRNGRGVSSPPVKISGGQPTLSPDDTHVILSGTEYVEVDLTRSAVSRLPYKTGGIAGALYSPDGARILYYTEDEAGPSYYIRLRDEAGSGQLARRLNNPRSPTDWSPDGRYILGDDFPDPLHIDIWVTPLDPDEQPFPLVQSPANSQQARFSPDGQWVAYTSDENGGLEVYVISFRDRSKRPRQISVGGGAAPMWGPDGKELFYLSPEKMMMAVPVDFTGGEFRYGLPKVLFQTRVPAIANARNFYCVSRNPERPFLILTTVGDNLPPPMHVMIR